MFNHQHKQMYQIQNLYIHYKMRKLNMNNIIVEHKKDYKQLKDYFNNFKMMVILQKMKQVDYYKKLINN